MPLITPKLGLTTAEEYQVNFNLPPHSFIKEFVAMKNANGWSIFAVTSEQQTDLLRDQSGKTLYFSTLEQVAEFLSTKGVTELAVSLMGIMEVSRG